MDRFLKQLSTRRSYQEAERIAGSMWAHDYKLLVVLALQLALTLGAVYVTDLFLKGNLPICPLRCNPLAPEPCCGWSTTAMVRIGNVGLVTMFATLFGAILAKKMTFAFSAALGAIVIIIVSSVLVLQKVSLLLTAFGALLIFLGSFSGYRLALIFRNRR